MFWIAERMSEARQTCCKGAGWCHVGMKVATQAAENVMWKSFPHIHPRGKELSRISG